MKVAVIGATGSTGQELVAYALSRGHTVCALARDPSRVQLPEWLPEADRSRLELVKGDIYEPDTILAAVKDADVVFEALGAANNRPTTIKLDGAKAIASAMKQSGSKKKKQHLIAISAVGILWDDKQKRGLPWLYRKVIAPFFLDNIYADLTAFQQYIEKQGKWLQYTIMQPGHIVPAPATQEFSLKPGEAPTQDLAYGDLALAMIHVAENSKQYEGMRRLKCTAYSSRAAHSRQLEQIAGRYH